MHCAHASPGAQKRDLLACRTIRCCLQAQCKSSEFHNGTHENLLMEINQGHRYKLRNEGTLLVRHRTFRRKQVINCTRCWPQRPVVVVFVVVVVVVSIDLEGLQVTTARQHTSSKMRPSTKTKALRY